MLTGDLPGVDFLRTRRRKTKEFRIAQIVIDHDLGAFEALATTQGEQAGIAGAGSHQGTDSPRRMGGAVFFFRALFFHQARS